MFFNKSWEDWIAQYETSHQNQVNRFCHGIGIPLIAISIPLLISGIFVNTLLYPALLMFAAGWIFQFTGHAFEHKLPEFFKDWRFLFVGLRWWLAKIAGLKVK